jgi:hypothetical protein
MSALHLRSASCAPDVVEFGDQSLPTEEQLRADPQLRPSSSLASSSRAAARDETERRDDRVEIIAIAISFILMIGGLAAIVAAVLLSRPFLRASGWLISQAC